MGRKRGQRKSHRARGHEEEGEYQEPYHGQSQRSSQSWQQPRKPPRIVVQAKTQGQRQYIIDIKNHDITFCVGPAGSGKTFIAIGLALESVLAQNPAYERIIIIRPAKEACGEKMGYLPGSLDEKLLPWISPVIDNMKGIIDSASIKNLFYQEKIEVIPVAFLRGRSLNNAFILVDEGQNITADAMKMILTRIGSGSKLVIEGDLDQDDHPQGGSGLLDAIDRLEGMEGVAVTRLDAIDIVRHPMIAEILRRYSPGYMPGANDEDDFDNEEGSDPSSEN